MKNKRNPGRPPINDVKMIRRTYQITAEQDRQIKTLAINIGISESAVVRKILGLVNNYSGL